MEKSPQIIYIQPLAPAKPPEGATCNGCGICCLSEPCPLGMVVSRKRSGTCLALHWDQQQLKYRCGALTNPAATAHQTLPDALRFMAPIIIWLLKITASRWIAAGAGCDSTLQIHHDPTTNSTD